MNENVLIEVVSIVTITFETFIVYMYMSGVSKKKRGHWLIYSLLYTLFGVFLYGASYVPIAFVPYGFVTFIGVFAILRYTDTGLALNHLFKSLMFSAYMAMSELIVGGVIILIEDIDFDMLNTDIRFQVIGSVGSKLLQVMLVKIAVVYMKRQSTAIQPIKKIILLSACQLLSIYLIWVSSLLLSGNSIMIIHFLLMVISVMFIDLFIFWYYDNILQATEFKHQSEALQLQIEGSAKYYDLVRSQKEAVDSINHDIQKHVQVMKGLFQNHADHEEAITYLDDLVSSMRDISVNVMTPNAIVNTILLECAQWAMSNQVTQNLDIGISEDTGITDPEITVVLGNTIENAKRALLNIEDTNKRRLNIYLKQKDYFLYYEISNTYDPTHNNSSNRSSRKYGLENIKHCAEKYNGKVDTVMDEAVFTIKIVFMTQKACEV